MGFLGKLFKGPEPDMEKSAANAKKDAAAIQSCRRRRGRLQAHLRLHRRRIAFQLRFRSREQD